MASRSPIMAEVARFVSEGRPVIGACNGFQILCEAGLLPGALIFNEGQKFICDTVELEAVNRTSFWTRGIDRHLHFPIAHGEGRFICDADELKRLQDHDQVAFRYIQNPNGSVGDIAGVLNKQGNCLGLMPHPERATREILGNCDGKLVLRALSEALLSV
jgi:phosphoribosylformylglycinamidine synthase